MCIVIEVSLMVDRYGPLYRGNSKKSKPGVGGGWGWGGVRYLHTIMYAQVSFRTITTTNWMLVTDVMTRIIYILIKNTASKLGQNLVSCLL